MAARKAMEVPKEMEAQLVGAAVRCLNAAGNNDYSLTLPTPAGMLMIEVRLVPFPVESKDAIRLVEESRPEWEPGPRPR